MKQPSDLAKKTVSGTQPSRDIFSDLKKQTKRPAPTAVAPAPVHKQRKLC